MKTLIVFFICASVVYGQYTELRVKYGKASEEAVNKEFFFAIPKTIKEAVAKGWIETVRPPSPLPHLKLYCFVNKEVCSLYHPVSQFLAGIQLALPAEGIEVEPVALQKHFVKWSVPSSDRKSNELYFAASQYFVPEDTIQFIPRADKDEILQYGGVWITGFDGRLMKVPIDENQLRANFTKQSCIPKMGTHYYYKLSRKMSCEGLFPWFPLVKDGKLIGIGYMLFAHRTKPHIQREWYEIMELPTDIHGKLIQAVLPDAPSCFQNVYSTYKYLAMHIYFIGEPWKVTCSPGDSIKPLPESIMKLF